MIPLLFTIALLLTVGYFVYDQFRAYVYFRAISKGINIGIGLCSIQVKTLRRPDYRLKLEERMQLHLSSIELWKDAAANLRLPEDHTFHPVKDDMCDPDIELMPDFPEVPKDATAIYWRKNVES